MPPALKPLARAHLFEAVPKLSVQGLSPVVRINSAWRDAFTDIEGKIVDLPLVLAAKRTIERSAKPN